ncbi:TRAP transporter large permease [Tropicimonas isoalkanivorans]|uniref:TRAP transporter large permease protein n=1 Tax=Tropicimonas isoalkanivorans TaxID=441112 RepID=A0A1I1I598_9RHOB|nr:TRAP transporter large permease [Tropicimonas isoalkanivorans]SFC28370.1 TRAP transporter, DctM subunit [Tropicimonas isoalkanivorans]
MSNLTIGFLSVPILLTLIALRVPIGLALGSVSLVGLIMVRGVKATLGIFGDLPMEFGASWTLSAVPMFIFMGALAFHTGLTKSLFEAARLWLSRLPGGLAIATNFASAGFAAASGSSLATCAAMGRIAIPEMLRRKYDPALASGCVAAAGTLGALIPPSIMFVLYGWYTETSIGALLMAGILPGLLTAFVYSIMIWGRCMVWPELGPPAEENVTWGDRFRILIEIWPIPLLILGVVGAIYSGLATATEAAAIGAFLAALIGLARGTLTRKAMGDSIVETLNSTASIFFVAIGALLFTRFFAFAGVPGFIAEQIALLALNQLSIILGLTVIYLILGMFLDPLGVLLLTLPVILPIFKAMGIDPIWAGVLVVKYLEIGMITPPVGLNVYVVKGVVGDTIALPTIFKGVLWFLAAEVAIMTLLIAFPSISTFLPNQLLGG